MEKGPFAPQDNPQRLGETSCEEKRLTALHCAVGSYLSNASGVPQELAKTGNRSKGFSCKILLAIVHARFLIAFGKN